MNKQIETFNALLVIAFVSQLVIDVLGFLGVYYNAYDDKVFTYSGYQALVSFRYSFIAYILWMLLHYASLGLLACKHFSAYLVVPLTLSMSFVLSFISGIYVGTPLELAAGWIATSTYMFVFAMAIFSSAISSKFAASYERFAYKNP